MGDSIRDLIVTPYITNLSGKDSNRYQMTRMLFRPDMFLGYVLSFVDEASEGEVSTFTIIFRIRFPTLVCKLKTNISFQVFLSSENTKNQSPRPIIAVPLDGNIPYLRSWTYFDLLRVSMCLVYVYEPFMQVPAGMEWTKMTR